MKTLVAVTVVALVLLLEACGGGRGMAPVSSRGAGFPAAAPTAAERDQQAALGYYVVQRGDTLYSIAWQYGFDYKTLADWNRVQSPYRIYAGQRLTLLPPAAGAQAEAVPAPREPSPTPAQTPAQRSAAASADEEDAASVVSGNAGWTWPAKGDLISTFNAGDNKGINLAGREGDTISAAADGRVVYSGSGLVGLGELVIIKHSGNLLSAYAHNKLRLVHEGDRVTSGQTIAQMGRTGTDRVMLHFEVRKDGKPVDPLQYLPQQR